MKTMLTAAVIAVALSSTAWAGKPLSDKQMDNVTAGWYGSSFASAYAVAYGAVVSSGVSTFTMPGFSSSASFSSSFSP